MMIIYCCISFAGRGGAAGPALAGPRALRHRQLRRHRLHRARRRRRRSRDHCRRRHRRTRRARDAPSAREHADSAGVAVGHCARALALDALLSGGGGGRPPADHRVAVGCGREHRGCGLRAHARAARRGLPGHRELRADCGGPRQAAEAADARRGTHRHCLRLRQRGADGHARAAGGARDARAATRRGRTLRTGGQA
ncbi:hypothetical protein T492DRAFT_90885 [Pavlovales sp. CCMP2436]|nr:hypothetical protein T492DRAFT_90885 [Pavlovales sp. CCMP2436]